MSCLTPHHRREARIDRDHADLALLADVLFRHPVASAVLHAHLDHERNIIGQSGDDVVGSNDFHIGIGDDVLGQDDAFLVSFDSDGSRLVAGVLHDQALDVQDDVGYVFDHTRNGADLVLDGLDLHSGDRAALQAGEQNTPQTVANRHAKAALERLRRELAVGVGQRRAIAHHAVGQFQPTPSDTHETFSLCAESATNRGHPGSGLPDLVFSASRIR